MDKLELFRPKLGTILIWIIAIMIADHISHPLYGWLLWGGLTYIGFALVIMLCVATYVSNSMNKTHIDKDGWPSI